MVNIEKFLYDFEKHYIDKGFIVERTDNLSRLRVTIKLSKFKRKVFELYVWYSMNNNLSVTLRYNDKEYLVRAFLEYNINVFSSADEFLFEVIFNNSLLIGFVSVIDFLIGCRDKLLSDVGYLILLNEDKKKFHWGNGMPMSFELVKSIDYFGKVMGYRMTIITKKDTGFKKVKYDVSSEVAGVLLYRYIYPKVRTIIPVELIDGKYRNAEDCEEIAEIKNKRTLISYLGGI